jgi:hypothetical protein
MDWRQLFRISWVENLVQDLRFALRYWRKKPGSFISAVAALTLGIGLVTFSICAINCVFFGRLPFPDSERVVYATFPAWAFRDFDEQQTRFEGLSAFASASVNFKAKEAPSRRRACFIGANFLDLIRAKPMLGRGFLPTEGKRGAEPVALIGYDLWQREFNSDPAAVGSIVRLNGQATTIVGVMPKDFRFPIDDDLWIAAQPGIDQTPGWGFAFGRLKPSITIREARSELNAIATRIAAATAPELKPSPICSQDTFRISKGHMALDRPCSRCCSSPCSFCVSPAQMSPV